MLVLIGETKGDLGQSRWLREVKGREDGPPPRVDLAAERRTGDFVRRSIGQGALTAVHDVSDGGLAVTVAEMALAGGIGAILSVPHPAGVAATYFAEDQGLYVATVDDAHLNDFLHASTAAGVSVERIGRTIAGRLIFETRNADHCVSLDRLRATHEAFFPKLMGPSATVA